VPTFERCQSCARKGLPADETPIVPEGAICQACEVPRVEKILSTCIDHGWMLMCQACGSEVAAEGSLADALCGACSWDLCK